jgi:hypothetical protein
MRYGLNKMVLSLENGRCIQFNSTLGIARTLFQLVSYCKIQSTQFTNGYSYPNKEISVSKPLPQPIFFSACAEYATEKRKINFIYLRSRPNHFCFRSEISKFGGRSCKAVYDLNGNLIRR